MPGALQRQTFKNSTLMATDSHHHHLLHRADFRSRFSRRDSIVRLRWHSHRMVGCSCLNAQDECELSGMVLYCRRHLPRLRPIRMVSVDFWVLPLIRTLQPTVMCTFTTRLRLPPYTIASAA